jgi:rubrerythrin
MRRRKEQMQISEAELRAMTAQMNEMHEATFPQMKEALGDLGSSLRTNSSSRRGFLAGGSALLGGFALAACGGGDEEPSAAPSAGPTSAKPSASASPSAQAAADASGLKLNASLENLAVFAYKSALEAAPKGMFGKVPPAVVEFATNAMKQHAEHAEAFNAALTKAGGEAFTMPNPKLAGPITEMFAALKDVPGLAKLALTLENTAAATYTKQMGEFTSPEALSAVATIAPVERQHAAILNFVLGNYPVPDTFVLLTENKTEASSSLGARPNSDVGG